MFRRLLLAGAVSLLAAGALAAVVAQTTPPPEAAASETPSPTAEVFAASLVDGIRQTLGAYKGDDFVALRTLLEGSIESVFVSSNVSPEAALDGVDQARKTLLKTQVMCDVPEDGIPKSRCEAVALAFLLAQKAAEETQLDGTSALDNGRNGSLPVVPSTGSGGGGGGVTHPPVSN